MLSSSPTTLPTPSMASWTVVVLNLMLVLLMFACVDPATATTTTTTTTNTMEHCLRGLLNPSHSPPPAAAAGSRRGLDLRRVVCRDLFRMVGHYLRSKGKLPSSYVVALCDVFGDDEKQVERYITDTFSAYDLHRLMAGRSCATIRSKHHPPPPSP